MVKFRGKGGDIVAKPLFSFHAWVKTQGKTKSQIDDFCREALEDKNFPWNASPQEMEEYLKRVAGSDTVDAFRQTWEKYQLRLHQATC